MGVVSNLRQLRSIYNYSKGRAALKVINSLEKHSKNFINLSPFVVISSKGKNGHADVSPRGDSVGFVKIQDDKTIIIPDRSGNNRLDTLENIIFDPSVGTLFFIPGINTVLRINGNAFIEDSLEIRAQFEINNNIPKTCIIINIEEIFMHCAKAGRVATWRVVLQWRLRSARGQRPSAILAGEGHRRVRAQAPRRSRQSRRNGMAPRARKCVRSVCT